MDHSRLFNVIVSQIGGEAVALRAIKQTALISLGVHYEILLRNDCMRTDEEQLALLNRHTTHSKCLVVLRATYCHCEVTSFMFKHGQSISSTRLKFARF